MMSGDRPAARSIDVVLRVMDHQLVGPSSALLGNVDNLVVQQHPDSLMIVGVIEYGRASGRLTSARWAWVMPAALIAIGLALGVHGGSAKHLPSHVEQLHHWILGVGLGGSGVVLLLTQQGRLKARAWRSVWTVALVILGLELAFFYRIPGMGGGIS